MTDLIRAEDNPDPENVGAATSEFHDELSAGAAESVALREMFYHLRRNETATSRELRSVAGESTDKLALVHGSKTDWWNSSGSQYLALVPGVIPPDGPGSSGEGYLARLSRAVSIRDSNADTWRLTDEEQPRPSVPEDPTALPDEYLNEALGEIAPDEGPTPKSKTQLRKLYHHLVENGSATSADLKELYETSRHDQREYGSYKHAADWFREVGRGCLGMLPGIDPPRTGGGEWRHIGVDPETLSELEGKVTQPSESEIEDRIAEAEVAGRGEWADHRRETLRAMYEHLLEEGSASASELGGHVDSDAVGFDSAGSFFDEIATDELAALPGVKAPDETSETWEYNPAETAA
jgi:hypothetical protein